MTGAKTVFERPASGGVKTELSCRISYFPVKFSLQKLKSSPNIDFRLLF